METNQWDMEKLSKSKRFLSFCYAQLEFFCLFPKNEEVSGSSGLPSHSFTFILQFIPFTVFPYKLLFIGIFHPKNWEIPTLGFGWTKESHDLTEKGCNRHPRLLQNLREGLFMLGGRHRNPIHTESIHPSTCLIASTIQLDEPSKSRGGGRQCSRCETFLSSRAHINDMENILPFLFLGAIYSLMGPSLFVARLHFLVFSLSRLLHTLAYLLALRAPTRSVAYTIAQIPCVSMAVQILMSVMAYA